MTEDFRRFERCGLVMQPDDKDAALLPRRIDGNAALLHRCQFSPARTSFGCEDALQELYPSSARRHHAVAAL